MGSGSEWVVLLYRQPRRQIGAKNGPPDFGTSADGSATLKRVESCVDVEERTLRRDVLH